jgi:serine/threonine protein kinase
MASALAEVHRHEIVHLDIKPANIIVNDATGELRPGGRRGGAPRCVRSRRQSGKVRAGARLGVLGRRQVQAYVGVSETAEWIHLEDLLEDSLRMNTPALEPLRVRVIEYEALPALFLTTSLLS